MKIDLLYFDGCPSWQIGLENLKTALEFENMDAQIHLINIHDDDQAAQLKFLGSPSFQVDGRDFWFEERLSYHLNCRVYSTPTGLHGAPSVEMLQEKLRSKSLFKKMNAV